MTLNSLRLASLALVLTLAGGAAHAQACEGTPSGNRLTIVVDGVTSAKGQMTGTLYPDDKSKFLVAGGSLKVWRVPVATPFTTMCIWLPAPGTYAIAIYQDLNNDGKFDVGSLGPKEPYGFSNNPRILFSKPSYDKVKFLATAAETTLHVRLNPA